MRVRPVVKMAPPVPAAIGNSIDQPAGLAPAAPPWLRTVPAVDTLRTVWVQQFYREGDAVRWRTDEDGTPPSATMIGSPYDGQPHVAGNGQMVACLAADRATVDRVYYSAPSGGGRSEGSP